MEIMDPSSINHSVECCLTKQCTIGCMNLNLKQQQPHKNTKMMQLDWNQRAK